MAGVPLLDFAGLWASHRGNKKAKKQAKREFKYQRGLQDKQVGIADYLQSLAKRAADTPSNIMDPFGGFTRFNPETGQYEFGLSPQQMAIQGASYGEELDRMTKDNAIRRTGLQDFERMRQRSSGMADQSVQDILAQRRGVGMVDPAALAGRMDVSNQRTLNAGYDDAERAARTLGLRTGAGGATGDALSSLARDRVRARASLGDPYLDALQMSEEINAGRTGQALDKYKLFGDEARGFYDAGFDPSQYEAMGRENLGKQMEFDLSKLDLGMGGSAKAAGVIGNAASGGREAYGQTAALRSSSPFANLASGASGLIGEYAKRFGSMGG